MLLGRVCLWNDALIITASHLGIIINVQIIK